MMTLSNKWSLNPFGTGQCLSTEHVIKTEEVEQSQSLWNRAMSFDFDISRHCNASMQSQSLWNRAMSFDIKFIQISLKWRWSQSLWNRAMSFDSKKNSMMTPMSVSIPLEQGNVFRQHEPNY